MAGHGDQFLLAQSVEAAGPQFFRLAPEVDATTMTGKLLMGYQGWFACPGDGSPSSAWIHWFRAQNPVATNATVDFWPDVTDGIIKSFVFGAAVSLIAVFEGYDSKPTAEGVSTATTRTVVISSLAILALDFVMTAFMFRGAV